MIIGFVKEVLRPFYHLINTSGVSEEEKLKVQTSSLIMVLGWILSFSSHCLIYAFLDIYNIWIFLFVFLCHASMIWGICIDPVRLHYFICVFIPYAASIGPIWMTYSRLMTGTSILSVLIIPLAVLVIAKNKKASVVALVIEIIKLVIVYPRIIENQIERVKAGIYEYNLQHEGMFTSFALIVIYVCFIFFIEGFRSNEKLMERMKKELETTNQNLQASIKQRETIILSLSHEIRNPLNIVLGNIDLCYEETMDSCIKSKLRKAKTCGQLLLSLINNLLDSGKADLSSIEVCPSDCAVRPLFENIWSSCKEIIESKGLKAEMIGLERLPAILNLDQYRITQIIINLVSNAVKVTQAGKVMLVLNWVDAATSECEISEEISLEAFEEERPSYKIRRFMSRDTILMKSPPIKKKFNQFEEKDGILELSILDTGPGISQKSMKSLFQKYNQVSNSENKSLGTGIGLWVTKIICEKMNGSITTDSKIGEGTKFTVKIHTKRCPAKALHSLTHIKEIQMEETKYNVMIVEDVFFNAEIIHNFIKTNPCFDVVNRVETGELAVEYYLECINEGRSLHLITMDLEMPGMGGKEACKRIRELEQEYGIPNCPIIIITGNCVESEMLECLDPHGPIKAHAFLRKPVIREEFQGFLRRLMKQLSSIS